MRTIFYIHMYSLLQQKVVQRDGQMKKTKIFTCYEQFDHSQIYMTLDVNECFYCTDLCSCELTASVCD